MKMNYSHCKNNWGARPQVISKDGKEKKMGRCKTTALRIKSWRHFVAFLTFCVVFVNEALALPETVKIGGLFDILDDYEELALKHAIQRVNSDPMILPRASLGAVSERFSPDDSFHASKKVCQILKDEVVGIIGPQSPTTSSHVQSICNAMEVPHVETKWDFRSSHGAFLINLFPHPQTLSRAYSDLIEAWGWNRYVILYDDNESLIRLQDILKASDPDNRQTTVKQLPPGDDYRPLFKEIRIQTDINSIIIDCDSSKLPLIFDHASQVNMMRNYRYFITSLDIQTLELENYLFGDINITAFRMIDRDSPEVVKVIKAWQDFVDYGYPDKDSKQQKNSRYDRNRQRGGNPKATSTGEKIQPLPNNMLKTETALLYDAIELYGRALTALDNGQRGALSPQSLECNPANPQGTWKQGYLLMETLKKVQFKGLTGHLQFDSAGYRSEFQLDIMELTQKGLAKIGSWDSRLTRNNEQFEWTRTSKETLKLQEEDLKNKTLIVSTKQSSPYFIVNNGTQEGYAIDLLDLLAETLQFNYVVREAADGSYGSMNNKTKHGWTGVIGEILAGIADVGIGDMTITHDREKTLDFTMPFMNLGISILYKKPVKTPPALFSFLEPFNYEVWLYMATAYLGVSLFMFVLARIAPEEWQEPPPCSKDCGEILENNFNMVNSLWFATGSILAQGCDILPKAASTRTVASMWWFFTLIMISSYTANLAAFLTSEGMVEGINDIKDLPKQTKVKYGSIGSGSTFSFFKGSSFPLYKEIYNNMQNMRPSPYVKSNAEGVERVKKSDGKYAFFMESASIDYQTERDCSLTQLGGPLDSKGYGIALRKNSKYRDAFNSRILELQEKGELEKLKVKWWKGKEKGGGICKPEEGGGGGAAPLTLGHVGGVFVVLLGGCICACVMATIEFLWKSRKLARLEHESFATEVLKDLRFALQCQGETKPVRKNNPLKLKREQSMTGSVPYLSFNQEGEGKDKDSN